MNKLVIVALTTAILLSGTLASQAFAKDYSCQLTVDGKGCVLIQGAKGDIKNTINFFVRGGTNGNTGGGGG